MSNPTDTNQASEDELDDILEDLIYDTPNSYGYPPDFDPDFTKAKKKLKALIRTEKLKLLDEAVHQSTVNLESARAVAGWAEIRKEQLEAEL